MFNHGMYNRNNKKNKTRIETFKHFCSIKEVHAKTDQRDACTKS